MIPSDLLPRATARRRSARLAAVALLLLGLPALTACWKDSTASSTSPPASAADPVVARVNGIDIRQSDLALAEEDVGADMGSALPDAKREQLIAYLTDIILVTQAAEK